MPGSPIASGTFHDTPAVGNCIFIDQTDTPVLLTGPYSLTQSVTVTHTSAGQFSGFDVITTVIPEPALALLASAGLLALVVRRKRG